MAVVSRFDGHDETCFVGPAPALLAAVQHALCAAEHRIVHLDPAIELGGVIALGHDAHEIVAHQARAVGAHAELAGEFKSRNRVLRLGQKIHP